LHGSTASIITAPALLHCRTPNRRQPLLLLRPLRPLLLRRLAAAAASTQQQLDAAPTRADAEALLNGDDDDDQQDEAEAVSSYVSYLNSQFGIPGLVSASVSPLDGGPQLELSHPPTGFLATVSLHGAVVTSLVRPGVGELLYLEDAHGNAVSADGGGSGEEGEWEGGRTRTMKGPRRPLAYGVAPAFPMVGRSDGVAAASGASWAQLPPDGILRHAHWSVAASGAATVHKRGGEEEEKEEEGEGAGAAVENHDDDDDDDIGWVDDGAVVDPAPSVCLVCSDSPATRALWPHAFSVAYTISLMATDDFPDEDEEEEEERKRVEEKRKKAAAEAARAAAAAAAEAAAEEVSAAGEGGAKASSSPRGTSPAGGKFGSIAGGGSATPAALAREAAAAAREAATRGVAASTTTAGASSNNASSSASSSEAKLPHDFPDVPPEDDPEGIWAAMPREDPPGPPPPPVQLRLVLEVWNPLEEEEGEGESGNSDESKNLVFGAAVSAALALKHAPLSQVRGNPGRVTLESSSAASTSRSRAPVLGIAPEEPLWLSGSREVECVWVGGKVKNQETELSSPFPSPASPSSSEQGSSSRLRGSALSPDSIVVDTGDYRHELELIPRSGFRDVGVRAPRPKPRARVPRLARALSEVDSAYAEALAKGSVFAVYPKDGGERLKRSPAELALEAREAGRGEKKGGRGRVAEENEEGEEGEEDEEEAGSSNNSGDGGGAEASTGIAKAPRGSINRDRGSAASAAASPSSSSSNSSTFPSPSYQASDFDNSGGARTLLERQVAVGLVGEIARPVTLRPGECFVGEAVIRIHDLSFDPRAERDFRWRRQAAARRRPDARSEAELLSKKPLSWKVDEVTAATMDVSVVDDEGGIPRHL